MTQMKTTVSQKKPVKKKILLVLLPFWDPQIPPPGISCLKSFLKPRGYDVKTVDANIVDSLNEIYHDYFDTLKEHIPGDMQGHFYKIGHDVLRNHMMAYLFREDKGTYLKLIRLLVYKTFYCPVEDMVIHRLERIIGQFYTRLEHYLLDLLEREMPDVLGLSVYEGTLPASFFAAGLTRKHYQSIKIVMGGGIFANQLAKGSPDMERFLNKTQGFIDKIIIGEGELLFSKLLDGKLPECQRVYTIDDIKQETLELSKVRVQDFSDFNLEPYPYLTSYGSRGCPFQCRFCSETVQWGTYRKKSPGQIADELIRLHEIYGSQAFLMGDSLLNPFISGLARELLKRGVSLYWDGYLRVDRQACDMENTLLWRRGGFYRARLGIESGSEQVLQLMNKKITPRQIEDTIYALAYAGIKTTTYWVIGYPGETGADFQQTLNLLEELKDEIYSADCTPFNYSPAGQVKSEQWADKKALLYPQDTVDMLMIPTWIVEGEPSRKETYQRMRHFVQHCSRLGIPNPYSFNEIYRADQRWKSLHKNAVPPLTAFKNRGNDIDDRKHIKPLTLARNTLPDNGTFGF